MLCTLITHPDRKEIIYYPCEKGEVRDVPKAMVDLVRECATERVQEVLNFVFHATKKQ